MADDCCAPGRANTVPASQAPLAEDGRRDAPAGRVRPSAAVVAPGGDVLMGTDAPGGYPADGEGPVHRVRVRTFGLEAVAATNTRFTEFVQTTGHVTDAERYGALLVVLGPSIWPSSRGSSHSCWDAGSG